MAGLAINNHLYQICIYSRFTERLIANIALPEDIFHSLQQFVLPADKQVTFGLNLAALTYLESKNILQPDINCCYFLEENKQEQ